MQKVHVSSALPFFAELPYYLWGQVNYDSEGDCDAPTDRNWTWLELTHRETDERLDITKKADACAVVGNDPAAARAALFLVSRCHGQWLGAPPVDHLRGWDHEQAAARAGLVRAEFERLGQDRVATLLDRYWRQIEDPNAAILTSSIRRVICS